MSTLEELVYSAYEQGKREELLKEVGRIRAIHPRMPLEEIYEKAYQAVMKT
tara:strand:- start:1876 stop:2028 length:153 start_codon:yes stop_codon:yes gene_type:complete